MKNNYIYVIKGWILGEEDRTDLGYWLSFGTAKADIKRMMENGILDHCVHVTVEQVKIGRYSSPNIKLKLHKKNNKWVTID